MLYEVITGPQPGVVVIHDVWGLSDHTRDLARRFAAEGFAALAVDLYRRLWEPLATSIMNTPASDASARLLWRTMQETLVAGGAACRPLVAKHSLGRVITSYSIHYTKLYDTLYGAGLIAVSVPSFLWLKSHHRIDVSVG